MLVVDASAVTELLLGRPGRRAGRGRAPPDAQSLRQRAHERLMRAFLNRAVLAGGVRVVEPARTQSQHDV